MRGLRANPSNLNWVIPAKENGNAFFSEAVFPFCSLTGKRLFYFFRFKNIATKKHLRAETPHLCAEACLREAEASLRRRQALRCAGALQCAGTKTRSFLRKE
jgi:hypothetical protein